MPKKLNTNPKAAEARARKETVKREKIETLIKQVEDEVWCDQGQSASEKRKQAKEAKKAEEAKKKALKKELVEKDAQALKKTLQSKQSKLATRVTQFELTNLAIEKEKQRLKQQEQDKLKQEKILLPVEIDEINPNHQTQNELNLSSITTAIEQLDTIITQNNSNLVEDRHPEKRLKSAFKAYEEREFSILKQENPTLKYSQLKDLLWKNWQKSSENPMLQQRIIEQQNQTQTQ